MRDEEIEEQIAYLARRRNRALCEGNEKAKQAERKIQALRAYQEEESRRQGRLRNT
jgi:hypothetical protein